jgi:ribonuclease HII
MSSDLLAFERELWRQGLVRVAGVDEAGRGPLAGPVSAAAVILPSAWATTGLPAELAGLNDSKQLTEAQREAFYEFIIACPEIRRAVVLVTAPRIDAMPQTALVKGDARSYSIAAASVVAKVTRDRLMLEYHRQWPEYGFAEHKGYGTAQHLAAIVRHGPCPIHRRSFAPLKQPERELFPR